MTALGECRNDIVYRLIWTEFSGSIRVLLDNRYVYQPFWDFHNGKIGQDEWKIKFQDANLVARKALAEHHLFFLEKWITGAEYPWA